MCEPSCQSQQITKEHAKRLVLGEWFCRQMLMSSNTYESNCTLATRIEGLNNNGLITRKKKNLSDNDKLMSSVSKISRGRVTFELLRRNDGWEETLDKIISDTIENYRALDSERGFMTFCLRNISDIVIAKTIREMWALRILTHQMKYYSQIWIEKRFAPGGKGYLLAKQHFNETEPNQPVSAASTTSFHEAATPARLG